MEWMFLKNNPFIRVLLPFIGGIILGYQFSCNLWLVSAVIVVILLFLFLWSVFIKTYSFRWVFGIFVFIALVLFGVVSLQLVKSQSGIFSGKSYKGRFEAIVEEVPVKRNDNYSTNLLIKKILVDSTWHKFNFEVKAIFKSDSLIEKLKAGQTIEFESIINNKAQGRNPFDFDYQSYLKLNGFGGHVFIKSGDWKISGHQINGLRQKAINLRAYLINQYKKVGLSDDELGLISALALGSKDELGEKVKKSFQTVGASHILSVSGMHVGIIYVALEFMLNFFFRNRKHLFKFLIIAFFLWFYAFLTGLSPSVLRATVMFSFVLFGKILNKPLNIYNSLAASAFFLLLFNPYLIFNVGFQLSYLAVAGIVFLYPKIYNLVNVKVKIIDKAWQLTSVSIAAQIATLPVCLYYFKQFPVYFWLSNLIITPGATLLIFSSILLLAISPIALLAKPVGFLVFWVAKILNMLVVLIAQLPFSTITNLPFQWPQMVFLSLFIIFGITWLLKRDYQFLMVSLVCVLFIIGSVQFAKITRDYNRKFCVYHIAGSMAIQFIDCYRSWWYIDGHTDTLKTNKAISLANKYWNIKDYKIIPKELPYSDGPLAWRNPFFSFDTLQGVLVNQTSLLWRLKQKTTIDYLILSGQPKFDLSVADDSLIVNKLIVEGSTPPWIANKWTENRDSSVYYLLQKQGAYVEIIK